MVKSRKNKSKYGLNKNRLSKRKKSILKSGGGWGETVRNFKDLIVKSNVKITYDDGSVYEGQMKDNKMNGIGKYTETDGTFYDGDWKDNMRNGEGFEQYPDGGEYEGEFKDDKMNGKGIQRLANGGVYDGLWNDDHMNGRGKYTDPDGRVYEGEWKDNNMNGMVKVTYPDGRVYEGEFKNNIRDVMGKVTYLDGSVYEGEWKDDKRNGRGKYTDPDGRVYDGEWENDEKNGRGSKWTDSDVYVGDWKDDKKYGWGKVTWADGYIYEGWWDDDKQNGQGTLTFPSGTIYNGQFKDDMIHGWGKITWANGDKYLGEWENDEKNGRGTLTFDNGDVYEGEMKDNQKNGRGKFTYANGIVYEGEFKDGKMNGRGKQKLTNGNFLEGDWKDGNLVGKVMHKTAENRPLKEYFFKDNRSYTFDMADINKYILTNYKTLKDVNSKYITILINLHGSDIINSFCQVGSNKHVRCITPVRCGISNIGSKESIKHAFQIAYNVSHLNDRNASTHDKIKKIIEIFNQDNPSYYGKNSFHRPMIDHTYSVIDPSDMFKEIFIIDTNHNTVLFEDMNYNLFDKQIDKLETITDIENYNILPKLLPLLTLNGQNWFFRSNLINVLLKLGYDTINMIDLSCRVLDHALIPRSYNHTLKKEFGDGYVCDYTDDPSGKPAPGDWEGNRVKSSSD